jgi:hypothetical protein
MRTGALGIWRGGHCCAVVGSLSVCMYRGGEVGGHGLDGAGGGERLREGDGHHEPHADKHHGRHHLHVSHLSLPPAQLQVGPVHLRVAGGVGSGSGASREQD